MINGFEFYFFVFSVMNGYKLGAKDSMEEGQENVATKRNHRSQKRQRRPINPVPSEPMP
jgi:hypothetical protein